MKDLVDAVKGTGQRDAEAAAEWFKEIHSTETEEQAEERRHENRSVRAAPATDGMVTTTEQRLADGLVHLCRAYAKGQVLGGRLRSSD